MPECQIPLSRVVSAIQHSQGRKQTSTAIATKGNVFDRMTDPKKYTGMHVQRFDADGQGKGAAGRDLGALGCRRLPVVPAFDNLCTCEGVGTQGKRGDLSHILRPAVGKAPVQSQKSRGKAPVHGQTQRSTRNEDELCVPTLPRSFACSGVRAAVLKRRTTWPESK